MDTLNEIETIAVPRDMFMRMSRALIGVEKFLEIKKEDKWISEERAIELLGCSARTLYRLKGKHIKYKAIGKRHQYCIKSIEKYNELMSA